MESVSKLPTLTSKTDSLMSAPDPHLMSIRNGSIEVMEGCDGHGLKFCSKDLYDKCTRKNGTAGSQTCCCVENM